VAKAAEQEFAAMIAGHFGFAAMVKGREPATPLWMLMLATVWLDIIFIPLYMMGIETLHPVPGARLGYGTGIIYADYTHSLVGAIVLSILLGAVGAIFWGRRSAIVIGLVSFSHWVLDLLVHRGDMPILPANYGNLPRLGFGLWRFPAVSAALELVLVLLGAWMYWRAAGTVTAQANRGRRLALTIACLIAAFGILILGMDVAS
jgi:membrane-bound metal-dependent hydrolase YbcI (DUF457 family)